MTRVQTTEAVGPVVRVTNAFNGTVEEHAFGSDAEAAAVARTVREGLSWVGTPFRDCADVKGPGGGVDCAMLLVRAFVDAGRVAPFDPRPYPPQWHMNRSEERFLEWLEARLGCVRVDAPRVGGLVVYHYGRCYSHGALVVSGSEIVHAYAKSNLCHVSAMTETDLTRLRNDKPRPRLFFEVCPWP